MKKQTLNKFIFIILLSILIGCNHKNQKSKETGVDFSEFITSVSKSTYKDFQGKSDVKIADEKSFLEMKNYILTRYKDVHVKQSFAGIDGQIVDCVPIEEQPASKLHGNIKLDIQLKAPAFSKSAKISEEKNSQKLPENNKYADITLHKGIKDRFGNEMYCPDGFIPIKRITLETLSHYKTLNNFFGKVGINLKHGEVPAPYGDGYDHNHVIGRQDVDNAGGDSWLNVWNPSVSPGVMSLSQQWFTGGSGANLQTIEGGWQVEPGMYSTNNACLFIYSTNANYSSGSGGYNLDNGAFIQISNQVYLAAPFDHYSETNGGQWGFNLQWKRNTDGNWWLFYKGPSDYIAVGYYPKSFYGTGQLSNFAQRTDFGGEVAGSPKEGQMGSGAQASQGWQKAAYQNRIFYILKDNIEVSAWSNLTKFEENSSCYTGDLNNIYGNWGTYLFFGGNNCN